ncbi:glycosyltransferase family 2 protein [Patescibacteria group bacterium]|nr:glycosyltransferase family 2 protein [Patescibacteria group bacterium]
MNSLSIIIPTYKRSKILEKCLKHIEKQTSHDVLEVIVVSDGPDEEAGKVCKEQEWEIPIEFLEIEKSQQGVARNHGIEKANSSLSLFIGDDIFLMPQACEKHIHAHLEQVEERGPISIAVLGHTTWDPNAEITSAMRWLEKSGWQFGYPLIKSYSKDFIPKPIQHRFTYTSHISVPTDIAREHPFREDVSLYGWEDVEWGERLKNVPLKLFYEPEAKAHHHHPITLEESLERMETLGRSVTHFPHLDRHPTGLKRIAYEIASLLPTMSGKHRKAFLRGLKRKE